MYDCVIRAGRKRSRSRSRSRSLRSRLKIEIDAEFCRSSIQTIGVKIDICKGDLDLDLQHWFWPPRFRRGGEWLLRGLHTRHVGHIAFTCSCSLSIGGFYDEKHAFSSGCVLGAARVRIFLFFYVFSSNAHGLLQVWGRLASFTSLLVYNVDNVL